MSLAAAELGALSYLVVGDFELLQTLSGTTSQLQVELNIPNTDGAVRIVGANGVIDAVVYGSAPSGIGEGSPAPAPSAEFSLQRCPPDSDTDDNLADFSVLPATPGGGCF